MSRTQGYYTEITGIERLLNELATIDKVCTKEKRDSIVKFKLQEWTYKVSRMETLHINKDYIINSVAEDIEEYPEIKEDLEKIIAGLLK
jgi:hypothetical protein